MKLSLAPVTPLARAGRAFIVTDHVFRRHWQAGHTLAYVRWNNIYPPPLFVLMLIIVYRRSLQTFLSDGHISFYATVREPDIICNVSVLICVALCQTNKCVTNILRHFFIIDEMSSRAVLWWRPMVYRMGSKDKTMQHTLRHLTYLMRGMQLFFTGKLIEIRWKAGQNLSAQ